ncbi:MAG: tryptophan--tRNA ligase [Nocardioides sp.]
MEPTLSLLKPTGRLTLGNYLGALRQMAAEPHAACYYGIADLHAMTVPHDPERLRAFSAEAQALLLAVGLSRATLFVQSRVPAHTELAVLLTSVATTGELNRMIQFKEKGRGRESTRVALFTYPVLMAADILLYRARHVPVGDDQRQHIELTRDLAIRFNSTYGETFVVPEMAPPPSGARVMNLQVPTDKMGKSGDDPTGIINLLDPADVIRRKIARAVTDSETGADAIRVDREHKPGVSNLVEILTACGGSAAGLGSYGALKSAVADAVIAVLEPIQREHAHYAADPAEVGRIFAAGAARCREVTAPTLISTRLALGLP